MGSWNDSDMMDFWHMYPCIRYGVHCWIVAYGQYPRYILLSEHAAAQRVLHMQRFQPVPAELPASSGELITEEILNERLK